MLSNPNKYFVGVRKAVEALGKVSEFKKNYTKLVAQKYSYQPAIRRTKAITTSLYI